MAPHSSFQTQYKRDELTESKPQPEVEPHRLQIVWKNVFLFVILHTGALYGLYLLLTVGTLKMWLYLYALTHVVTLGSAVGSHRLWAHRTYSGKLPLRIFLTICQTFCMQNDIHEWVRDHRVHHKYVDTDADPHSAAKGFFFSHMGWLMVKKHKDVIAKGKTIDMSDVEADPVVMFQKKYYIILAMFIGFLIPAAIPWYFWNENFMVSFYIASMFRYTMSLHGVWLVNSAAHKWGNKPYDKNMYAVENMFVSHIGNGEGFHNYHHTFPWDYRAAELDSYYGNLNAAFIDLMAKIGQAYDLKTANRKLVEQRAKRTGDGSRKSVYDGEDDGKEIAQLWGWGDKDMGADELNLAEITHRVTSKVC